MLECNNRFEDRAFLLLLAGVSLAFLWMLRPFFDVIFWGIVIALLSTPVYDALQRRSMGRNLAALTCVILSLVLMRAHQGARVQAVPAHPAAHPDLVPGARYP